MAPKIPPSPDSACGTSPWQNIIGVVVCRTSSIQSPGATYVTKAKMSLNVIEPIGMRVLIRKDEERRTTRGGIHLPDEAKIPVITGRIVALSLQVDNDTDYPLRQYDKVVIDPSNSIPVDFERDNKLFIIPIEDVVAVIRKGDEESSTGEEGE